MANTGPTPFKKYKRWKAANRPLKRQMTIWYVIILVLTIPPVAYLARLPFLLGVMVSPILGGVMTGLVLIYLTGLALVFPVWMYLQHRQNRKMWQDMLNEDYVYGWSYLETLFKDGVEDQV